MEYKIPSLPTTLGAILQVLARETPVPDDHRLVAIIEKDPAISIYVLRQVNSAYYGLQRPITEISRAVTLLGLKQVCNLVLAVALKQTFAYLEDTEARRIYEHVIKTSVASAAFARDLLGYLRLPLAETAFTAGLLHQLGRLVFLYSVPHLYVPLWKKGTAGTSPSLLTAPSLEDEHLHFNTDYLRLGASTLRAWKLPEELAIITKRLQAPDDMTDGPLRALTLAVAAGSMASNDLFADRTESEEPVLTLAPPLIALATLQNLTPESLATHLDEKSEAVHAFVQSILA